MLNRNIDMVLMGRNYLSYIFSIELLRKGKKVLLVDDDRIKYGDLFTNSLRQLEKNYLKKWGEKRGIKPLTEISSYLKIRHLNLVFDQTRLSLGDTPSRNFVELLRKLPFATLGRLCGKYSRTSNYAQVFEQPEVFNSAYNEYLEKVAYKFFNLRRTRDFENSFIYSKCPQEIKDLFYCFCLILNTKNEHYYEQSWTIKTLFYLSSGFFHGRLSIEHSKSELFHLFLCILSPQYELGHKKIVEDLNLVHSENGGEFKKTQIKDMVFHKKRPWAMELGSYEGIIRLKELSLLGGEIKYLPISFNRLTPIFACLSITWTFNNSTVLAGRKGERTLYSSLKKIGTKRPFLEVSVVSNKEVKVKVFVAKLKGMKVSLIIDTIRESIYEEISSFLALDFNDISEEKVEFDHDILFETEKGKTKSNGLLKGKNDNGMDIFENSARQVGSKVENVKYFGPYIQSWGVLSSLMNISRDIRQRKLNA